MRARLGIDIDGVVADFQGGWATEYEHWWPGKLDWSTLDSYNAIFDSTHFGSHEEFWAWTDGTGLWSRLKVIDGAQGVLYDLYKQDVDIQFITGRKDVPWQRHTTGDWLLENFGFLFTERIGGKTRMRSLEDVLHMQSAKSVVPCNLYLDDTPSVIDQLRQAQKTVVTFDQPWNQEVEGLRVRNWKQFHNLVQELIA